MLSYPHFTVQRSKVSYVLFCHFFMLGFFHEWMNTVWKHMFCRIFYGLLASFFFTLVFGFYNAKQKFYDFVTINHPYNKWGARSKIWTLKTIINYVAIVDCHSFLVECIWWIVLLLSFTFHLKVFQVIHHSEADRSLSTY